MNIALAILAHPDDAEILCAGTLTRLAGLGWKIHIATMTAGDCGTMDRNRFDISSVRTTEARNAAALIGGTYHCVGELDGLVCYDKATIQKVTDLFRRIAPTLVFTHAPKDYMLDHEQTSLLARNGSFLSGAPNASVFPLLPNHHVPHLYYCDPLEGVDPMGNPVTPTTLIDITATQEKKLAMLACHESQRAWLKAHHNMDEYLEATRRHDAARGKLLNIAAAEAFIQHRGHAYPHNDLLKEILP